MVYQSKIKQTAYQEKNKKFKNPDIKPELINMLKKDKAVVEAAELLKKGEVVALPTETVYGLAADALNPEAVKKIFKAKGRPQDNPLIVHIAQIAQLKDLIAAEIPEKAVKLIENFWPGPLTIIFDKSSEVPEETSAGLDTVAVRMPAHPLMLAVIEKSGLALAAPSANTSGYPSPTKAEHVYSDLKGKIPLILDGGSCHVGVESTVIDIRNNKVVVLRPGGISREQLAQFLGEDISLAAEVKDINAEVASPGMKYRHYAPRKKVYVFNFEEKIKYLEKAFKDAENKKVALITARETELEIADSIRDNIKLMRVFSHQKPEELANKLFDLLRRLDQDTEIEEIYIEALDSSGMGEAVMNRIYKAAAAEEDFHPGGGDN